MHQKIPALLLLPLLVGIWHGFPGFQNHAAAVFFGVLTWLFIMGKEAASRRPEKRAALWIHQHRQHPSSAGLKSTSCDASALRPQPQPHRRKK